ncbi:HEPN domain-containing protein [Mycolicibacterium porcinum]
MSDIVGGVTMNNSAEGPVESLYEDYVGLLQDLRDQNPSGLAALNRSFHKVVLIAAASNLEARVKRLVKAIFESQGRAELSVFIDKAVLARGYHTLFSWNDGKATTFFTHFGDECSKRFKQLLKSDDDFRVEHDAFMQLGSLRNQLVHQDYASFMLDATPGELIALYRHAIKFPERFAAIIFEGAEDAGREVPK